MRKLKSLRRLVFIENMECILHWDIKGGKATDYHLVIYYQKDRKAKKIILSEAYKRYENLEIDSKNLLDSNKMSDKIRNVIEIFEEGYAVYSKIKKSPTQKQNSV
ncbi:hypothetical protein DSECCO2_395970 [anaerobic digester metagenome]